MEQHFYRYDWHETAVIGYDGDFESPKFPNPNIYCHTYNLHKETPKGYWIGFGYMTEGKLRSESRWVSKTSKKRYAYPTKQEALVNFIKRNEVRRRILKREVMCIDMVLSDAQRMYEKELKENE